jgi:hypothetical protein
MDIKDLYSFLNEHPGIYEWERDEREGGVVIKNNYFHTVTLLSDDIIKANDRIFLEKATHRGKNIEQITRVTGYFAKINGFNKGKLAEVRDRHRSDLDKEGMFDNV